MTLRAETMASESSSSLLSKIGRHLAHELNNPISAITSSAYLIQDMIGSADGTISTEEIRPFVESIQEECATLKATVEEFSKYATTEKILPSRIDLTEFIRARAEEMAREGWPVTASAPEGPCFVNVDSGGLAFIFRAVAEAAKNDGAQTIHFGLTSSSAGCEIIMTDDRPSSSDLSDVFSAETVATRPRGSGLGLKLPLAKKIAELHGGTIEVAAQTGTKTRIIITLPVESSSSA